MLDWMFLMSYRKISTTSWILVHLSVVEVYYLLYMVEQIGLIHEKGEKKWENQVLGDFVQQPKSLSALNNVIPYNFVNQW